MGARVELFRAQALERQQQPTQGWLQSPPLSSRVNSGKSHDRSVPQIPHL